MREGEAAARDFSSQAEVDQLDAVFAIDHDVFRLQVAVNHSSLVDVFERFADADGDAFRALGRELLFFVENLAQQPPFHPFHRHVHPAGVKLRQHLHHAGMIEFAADFGLAMEAIEEKRIALQFGMGNLEGHHASVAQVGGAEDGGHAAARDQAVDAVMIELVAGTQGGDHRGLPACVCLMQVP